MRSYCSILNALLLWGLEGTELSQLFEPRECYPFSILVGGRVSFRKTFKARTIRLYVIDNSTRYFVQEKKQEESIINRDIARALNQVPVQTKDGQEMK